jgi:excisionase family DNA binding protein
MNQGTPNLVVLEPWANQGRPTARAVQNGRNSESLPEGTWGTNGRLLTIQQVADLLQVPASWVYGRTRTRSADRIPGFRLGKYWRFRRAEVETWVEGQRRGA